ncbi:MAG: LysR family transcriptional regulator [Opitutaceae bacterium]|jgi:DNA-binding transcriptional LysR family regulator
MIDYRLHVFRVVAEQLNFTRAAGRLHISQPAVTQHIKHLESHYGQPLFVRAPGGITLTAAGHALLEHAVRVEVLSDGIAQRLREGLPLVAGPLKLAASTTIAQYLLPDRLGRFRQAHPQVELSLRMGNTEEVAGALLAGRIDLGLIEGPSGRSELKTERFAEDEIVPVVAPDHPLAKKKRVTAADLAATPCVLRETGSGTRQVVERAFKRAGINPGKLNVIMEIDSSETIKGLIETGVGVAYLSRLALRHELARGCLAELNVKALRIMRPLFLLYPQGPRPTGATGVFMDFLGEPVAV